MEKLSEHLVEYALLLIIHYISLQLLGSKNTCGQSLVELRMNCLMIMMKKGKKKNKREYGVEGSTYIMMLIIVIMR